MAVGMSGPRATHAAVVRAAEDPDGVTFGDIGSAGQALDPDDLPDGLVVADETGRIICFNAAAARITAMPRAAALGRPLEHALPLEDLKGRRWWELTDPYGGLATRVGQPERNLLLPGGREVLVSARYVRESPTGPVQPARGQPARHRGPPPQRTQQRRTHRDRRPRAAFAADVREGVHRHAAGQVGAVHRRPEAADAGDRLRRRQPGHPPDHRAPGHLPDRLRASGAAPPARGPLRRRRTPHPGTHRLRPGPGRFLVRTCQPLPTVWADPDKVDQVLGNLLENAVRHGEGTVTIEVAPAPAKSDEKGTAVTVSDEGPGIPEESMARVFTRFWRGSKRGGTGLGLYIVKGIVEAHGGTITVGRGPGGGAEFRFILPVSTPAYMK